MKIEQGRQPGRASEEHPSGSLDVADRAFDFRGPLFRSDEAACYLNYRGPNRLISLYKFLKKRGVPTRRRFRTLLIKKADLDRALEGGRSSRQQQTR